MVNRAFERRVHEVFMSDVRLPLDVPISEAPPELQRHGSVVVREAAARRQMALLHQGRWCGACDTWYPITADNWDCPHCGFGRVMRIGSRYIAVTHRFSRLHRGKPPIVHAMVTERWLRRDGEGFERQPGQTLCWADKHTRNCPLELTALPVSCMLCQAKIKKHLGGV